MAKKKQVITMADLPKEIDQETYNQMKIMYLTHMFSFEKFCEHYFKDDPQNEFTVPSRNNMIQTQIPQFQSEIMMMLQRLRVDKRLCLASPRGFCKSTTCSVFFPIWCSLFEHFREILIVSNSETLAINFLRAIKMNLESNTRITNFFGKQDSKKWTETHIINNFGVSIRACGWGAQIRGFRPDLIILDDIESDETVGSEDVRNKMKDWVLKAAINSLSSTGSMLWVGTLITRLALIHEWIHNPPGEWKTKFLQAYKDGVMEPGHELWPEERTHSWLQARKAEIGSVAFSSEYMNDPIPAEGNRFNPKTFKYFEDRDIEGKDLGMYISIDPAYSEESKADFGVIMCCLHDSKDNIYVDRYFRQRTTSGKLIEELKRIWSANRFRIRGIGIEENGPQKAFYQMVVNEFTNMGQYPPFKKLTGMIKTNRGIFKNKVDRITYSLQPRFEAGKIFLRRDQNELIDELTLFPEVRHDDVTDALAYITALVEPLQDYSQELDYESEYDITPISRGLTGYGDSYEEEVYSKAL